MRVLRLGMGWLVGASLGTVTGVLLGSSWARSASTAAVIASVVLVMLVKFTSVTQGPDS